MMSADNSSFPPDLYTERSSMLRIVLKAKYQPQDTTVLPVYNPLPGSWFAAAYLPDWDQHVQQEVWTSEMKSVEEQLRAIIFRF